MSRHWYLRLTLVVVSAALALALAELALRASDFSYYWALYKRPDPARGWGPPPGVEAWQRLEGRALVRINGAGFRDREHATAKPPNTLRIAVLGDSFTEAVQVPLENTFWSLLEQRLHDCAGEPQRPVEVINFGVSGYSTAQELLTLRTRVWAFQPDLVLLAFFAANDIVENSRALDRDPLRPYFVHQDKRLVLDDAYLESDAYRHRDAWYGRAVSRLIEHSRLLQAVYRAIDLHRVREEQGNIGAGDVSAFPVDPRLDVRIFSEPTDVDWNQAWTVTEGLLKEMQRDTLSHGAGFLVVTLSLGIQVHPDPEVRARFQEFLGVDDLFYPERRIHALGERENFPVINLAPVMQFAGTFYGLWLHGFANSRLGIGHWNEAGHAMAADQIADTLCRGALSEWLASL